MESLNGKKQRHEGILLDSPPRRPGRQSSELLRENSWDRLREGREERSLPQSVLLPSLRSLVWRKDLSSGSYKIDGCVNLFVFMNVVLTSPFLPAYLYLGMAEGFIAIAKVWILRHLISWHQCKGNAGQACSRSWGSCHQTIAMWNNGALPEFTGCKQIPLSACPSVFKIAPSTMSVNLSREHLLPPLFPILCAYFRGNILFE